MGWLTNVFSWRRAPVETKAAVPAPINATMPSYLNAFLSPQEITAWNAWQFYKNQGTLAKVIDLIADEVSRLKPQVHIGGQPIEDHPALEFLRRPGFNRTRQRLIKELAVQYLVTGTAYPVVYGNAAMAGALPIAVDCMKSQFVNPIQGQDMWPSEYWYAEGTRSQQFHRDPSNPRDFRWLDQTGLAEIVPIYDMDGDRRGVGLSKLNAVKLDVELRIKGIQHNASVLDNGARLSGVLNYRDGLSDDQKADISAQMRALASGVQNAGKVMVTSGGESEFTAFSQNMKDMDFAKLIQIVEDAIVARYSVPVTLFRTDAQTNNNYETAWRIFYNLAVLPCFEVIYSGLSHVFSERLGQDIEIVHDELDNPILASQALDRALKLTQGHLVSRNEARAIVGYEPVLGGDTIYGSVSDVPQAEDYFTDRGINDPDADNSREAFHEVRPPPAAPGSEDEAGDSAKPEDNKKPGKKKPTAKDKEQEKAFGVLLDFAAALERGETKSTSGRRKAA